MAVKLASLKADTKRENEGDWVPWSAWGPGVAFKVRASTYEPFRQRFSRETMRLAKKYEGESVPANEAARVSGMLLAEEILLDWRGLDEDYSPDRAREILEDPAYREVREAVAACADKLSRVNAEFAEGEGKNFA